MELTDSRPPGFERQKSLMLGALFGALAALALVSNVRALWGTGNLARGKTWQASSSLIACEPERKDCGGNRTSIFFHTVEEENPWVQIDLAEKTRFSAVTVKNRMDCCQERAQPLIVEVGDDGQTWREVARNDSVFFTWRPEFQPVEARFVRLRVPKRSQLHLEQFAVHR